MNKHPHISVVIPVYGCRTCLAELYLRLKATLETINPNFEIIMVNDASPDNAWETIVEMAKKDTRVKGINLSRNFGQHYAITAGLDHCKGEWIVVMDCDLQDQPEEIVKLYNKALEGWDMVVGRRVQRKDTFFKRKSSEFFYYTLSYLTDSKFDSTIGTYRIISKRMLESFKNLKEYHRFFGAMINWVGYSTSQIDIEHKERVYGKSSYNLRKTINLALNGILSFSDKPLRLAVKLGFFITIISSLFILYKVLLIILYGSKAIGWSSLIASIFFSTGLIVSILGITGLYLGKIFEQVKNRPLYIVKDLIN